MSRQDMDLILSDGINAAVHFIEKNGEFYPFGVVKTTGGEIRHIQVSSEDSRFTSDDVFESLKTSLKESGNTGEYETVAIVRKIELTEKETGNQSDAICVAIDDRDSDPVLCYIPYRVENGPPILGDITAGTGARIAFSQ